MHNRIIIDPAICHGKPVIAGTRTPVATILRHLAGGDSFQTIQREYDLTDADIHAAVAFAGNDRIAIEPGVMLGKPHVIGTRITVEFVVGLLADCWSADDVAEEYSLTPDDVRACVSYHEMSKP